MPSPSVAERYTLNDRGFGTHQAMVELLRPGSRVLDVGCAAGLLGEVAAREKGCQVTGLEADPEAASLAGPRLARVVQGDVTDPSAVAALADGGPYDHIVLGDVLEHLVEPLPVLTSLVPLLDSGGSAVVSLPNVVSLKARARLAAGTWQYEDQGIFDRTHLRFYSVRGMRELLSSAGLAIRTELPVGPLTHRLGRRAVAVNRARPGLLATQVVFDAVPERP